MNNSNIFTPIFVRNGLSEEPSVIASTYKAKYRVSYSVDIKNNINRHLKY